MKCFTLIKVDDQLGPPDGWFGVTNRSPHQTVTPNPSCSIAFERAK